MSLETIVSTYGYPAIAVGTFFEGETILVLAGFAAHRGYLHLPWVVIWGFVGTLCGDQLYFHLGRFKGIKFLEERPHWSFKSQYVFDLLQRHQVLLILGFRFLYGLRTVAPFLLGASGVSSTRFFVLNTLGGLVWAISIGISGYLFGHVAELFIGDIRRYELLLFVALAFIGSAMWAIRGLKRPRMGKRIARPKE
jgi:membrane protein DedA with SNARE-associated domain